MSYRGGKWGKQERDKTDTPSPPYGELLLELNQQDISESSFSPKIADCEYIASYSWLQSGSSTIIVPGMIAEPSVHHEASANCSIQADLQHGSHQKSTTGLNLTMETSFGTRMLPVFLPIPWSPPFEQC